MEKINKRFQSFIKAHKRLFLGSFIAIQTVFFLSLVYAAFFLYQKYNATIAEREYELKTLVSLEKLLIKHDNYPQLYYEAGLRAARLNDKQKSLEYLEKALELNPDFKPALELQKREME